MPHADSSLVPKTISSKTQFYDHVYEQLMSLLKGQRNWVTNCANAASLIYNSMLAFEPFFGTGDKSVNWCGVYMDEHLFPQPLSVESRTKNGLSPEKVPDQILLGPFCGKPACQFINTTSGKARGVCADAFLQKRTLVVPDVDAYPGHIACDGETKSEIVCPLMSRQAGSMDRCLGVLYLDCLALGGFGEEDREGLERISKLLVDSCDW